MFVGHRDQIEKKAIVHPAMKNIEKQVLIGPAQGWFDYVMRLFTVGPHGHAPRHSHSWPHIMYVVEGTGNLFLEGKDHPLSAGSVAYVPSDADHQVQNTSDAAMVFICIVPEYGDK